MRLFQVLLLCVMGQAALAQNQVAVRSEVNGKRTMFYRADLQVALNDARNGDTLLLPAGDIALSSPVVLSKRLTLLGVGHQPEMNGSVSPTRLTGDLVLTPQANQSYISGVVVTGDVRFGQKPTDQVRQVSFVRCRLNNVYLSASENGNADQAFFHQNIITGNVNGKGARTRFAQNVFAGTVRNLSMQTVFTNNLFLTPTTETEPLFDQIIGGTAENNIFLGKHITGSDCRMLTFNNNVFTGEALAGENNLTLTPDQLFNRPVGNAFDYQADYRLKAGSPAQNAGTNGSDIGLFGTNPTQNINEPFSTDYTPFNPVIRFPKVDQYPTAEGKVSAKLGVQSKQSLATLEYWFNNDRAGAKTLELTQADHLLLDIENMGIGAEEATLHFQVKDAQNQYSSVYSTDFHNFVKPIVAFTADQTTICTGKKVSFTNQSRHAKSYRWEFGDGQTSTEADPIITFTQAGTITVKLTATHILNGTQASEEKTGFITVNQARPAVLNVSQDTVVCAGSPVVLNCVGAQPDETYRWLKDGKPVENATESSFNVKQQAGYQLEITDKNGCISVSKPVKIGFLALQLNHKGDTMICEGQKVMLQSVNKDLPDGTLYQWYRYGELIFGENNPTLTAQEAGIYTLKVWHPASKCVLEQSANVLLNVFAFQEEGQEITFCIGGTQCLNVQTLHAGQQVRWYFNGQLVAQQNGNKQFCTNKAGIYLARVIAPNGCVAEAKAAKLHCEPVLLTDADSIYLPGKYASVQWMVNGMVIPGATQNVLVSRMNGNYTVKVKDQCGTEAVSNTVRFTFTDREDFNRNSFRLYPNPVQDQMTIDGLTEAGILTLADITGRILATYRLTEGTNQLTFGEYPAGIYVMTVQSGAKVQTTKVVKN
jgi:hypothetical protein